MSAHTTSGELSPQFLETVRGICVSHSHLKESLVVRLSVKDSERGEFRDAKKARVRRGRKR